MFQLTEELIKEFFAQLGIESDFFPVFEKEARRTYEELQKDEPDEETTKYEHTNVYFSLEQARNFVLCYSKEKMKGHCDKWADAYARSYVYWKYSDDYSAYEALQAMEGSEIKEHELEVHANAINKDPVFKERYKTLISDFNPEANELAEEYTKVYHRCVEGGKSTDYAHAYAYASHNYEWDWCWDKYARAYEISIQNGKDAREAYYFAEYCVNAIFQGVFTMQYEFGKTFKEEWQREFYICLMCEDCEEVDKEKLSEAQIEDLRKRFL